MKVATVSINFSPSQLSRANQPFPLGLGRGIAANSSKRRKGATGISDGIEGAPANKSVLKLAALVSSFPNRG